jgi:hypothetical protein
MYPYTRLYISRIVFTNCTFPVSTSTSRLSAKPCECAIADVLKHRVLAHHAYVLYWRPAPPNECAIADVLKHKVVAHHAYVLYCRPAPPNECTNVTLHQSCSPLFNRSRKSLQATCCSGSRLRFAILEVTADDMMHCVLIFLGFIYIRIGAYRSYAICVAAMAKPGSQSHWATDVEAGQTRVTSNQIIRSFSCRQCAGSVRVYIRQSQR